jgi:hypothetical protein
MPRTEEVAEEPAFLLEELASGEDTVEALPEDDLWGAFELEEVAEDEPAAFEAVLEKETVDPFAELEALDEFTLGEERRPVPPVILAEAAPEPAEEAATTWQPAAEETFTLGEESGAAGFEIEAEEPFALSVEEEPAAAEPVSGDVFVLGDETEELPVAAAFAEPPAAAPASVQEVELQFAPEEEYVPVLTPVAPAAPSLSAAPAAAQPAASGEAALSEEQLASIVSKISRDIIEKIAWEVVPALAEMLIREEIRKLKKGLAD